MTPSDRSASPSSPGFPKSRSVSLRVIAAVGAIALFAGFVALGTWQIQRRVWKLDLIARVEQRVHAPAVTIPPVDSRSPLSADADEYRHVRATGTLLYGSETLVQAVTELGPGFWVLTPLALEDGRFVMINRGFVPPEWRTERARGEGERGDHTAGPVTITGLLRRTEPGGAFLHHNDAGANRWYSRDVAAIAKALGLHGVAPYFIDEDAATPAQGRSGGPVGGLTVIAFRNDHLVYAITWYMLALMVAGAAWRAIRADRGDDVVKQG